MSYKTKAAAQRAADRTAKLMVIGKGKWRTQVWENLGWHASIQWKFLSLSIYRGYPKTSYMLLIGHGGTGFGGLSYNSQGQDPNKLVREAVPIAIQQLKYWTNAADWLKQLVQKELI